MGVKFIQISNPDMQRLEEALKKADPDRSLKWVWS
jgi:hypothetical protein